jgi:hypothetical protein
MAIIERGLTHFPRARGPSALQSPLKTKKPAVAAFEYPWLPVPSALDDSELPSSSTDPLGLLANAERVAELMLPNIANRMRRSRLITLGVLSVLVSERVQEELAGDDGLRETARLAFERLAITAIVKQQPDAKHNLRLPGKQRATKALRMGQPLTERNFLAAPAINAPSGVYWRLAQQAQLVRADERTDVRGNSLLEAWARDEGLDGLLDAGASPGAKWLGRAVETTRQVVEQPTKGWPPPNQAFWAMTGNALQLDHIGRFERAELRATLRGDAVRSRMIELMSTHRYHAKGDSYPEVQRNLLWKAIRPALDPHRADDERILHAIIMAEGLERTSEFLQRIFDALLAMLKDGGSGAPEMLLASAPFAKSLDGYQAALRAAETQLRDALTSCKALSGTHDISLIERDLLELQADALQAAQGGREALESVLLRHERTQAAKQKQPWIHRGEPKWTVSSTARENAHAVAAVDGYRHPFRIAGMYSMMRDVGIPSRTLVGETDSA